MRFLFALLAAVVGSPLLAAERPNVVLILADDMRPDCVGALGHPVVKTPHLDRLVREGTTFTRAVAAYPICHVSRAELLTGCTAFRCGVPPWNKLGPLDPALKTWAGTFRDAGYHTWYTGKWHSAGRPKDWGFTESRRLYSGGGGAGLPLNFPRDHAGRPVTGYTGWTFKTDDGKPEPRLGLGLTPETDQLIADGAVELVRRRPDKPFLLHVNFTAPHDPRLLRPDPTKRYDPATIPLPPAFRPEHGFDHGNNGGRDEVLLASPRDPDELRRELAVYYACITNVDEQVGRILKALDETKQLDNTVVIFSSDQGLALGSHGLTGKQNLYDHTFGVPLLVRGPGVPAGVKRGAGCYLRDLFPTTCEMAGIPIPDTAQGRSFVPVLRGTTTSIYPALFGYFTDTQRCVRTDRWKLIRYPKADVTQLFDLKADPNELHDLAGDPRHRATVEELLALLRVEQKKWDDKLELFPGR